MAYSINKDDETQLNEVEERIIELEKQLAEAKRPNENSKLNMQNVSGSFTADFIEWLVKEYRMIDGLWIHKHNAPKHECNWKTIQWVYEYWCENYR